MHLTRAADYFQTQAANYIHLNEKARRKAEEIQEAFLDLSRQPSIRPPTWRRLLLNQRVWNPPDEASAAQLARTDVQRQDALADARDYRDLAIMYSIAALTEMMRAQCTERASV